MGVKVIEPGDPQVDPSAVSPDEVWHGICPKCGCSFEVTGNLLTRHSTEGVTYSCQNRTCHERVKLTYKGPRRVHETTWFPNVVILSALGALCGFVLWLATR